MLGTTADMERVAKKRLFSQRLLRGFFALWITWHQHDVRVGRVAA